ncbi:unnamed protein product [Sphenostylis stenocarpa]|uniref:Uncharacterized protein n=1 Tax=Sphenostylis stenocarpa TaxID=92480 RepID=A0AA86SLX9_9FABA|nr:unnamed protein product [Sphenostylis stenocarpa]
MVNANGKYFHKDKASHAAEVAADSDDEEMSIADIPVIGTSSGAHTKPRSPLRICLFDMKFNSDSESEEF